MGKSILGRTQKISGAGFTLVELLVVVGVVSVLAGMLLPTLKSARETAKSAQCMSNLRQLGIAMNLHGETYGYYPWSVIQDVGIYSVRPNYSGDVNSTWSFALNAFLGGPKIDWGQPDKRSKVLVCPADAIKYPNNVVSSYGVHAKLFGNTFEPGQAAETRYPRAYPFEERPNEVIMMGDVSHAVWMSPMDGHNEFVAPDTYTDYSAATQNNVEATCLPGEDNDIGFKALRFRHNNRANFVFIDGHVESYSKDQFRERNLRTTTY
ncbi:MAG: DUF1559 domain-containing protein [Verrucomicrobiae bacterium]|nr:DUF1559 domain-containing protein [Verrucomicrobiae bacterium]